MNEFLFKALSSKTRLQIISALMAKDELCVCEIAPLIRKDISTVSRHVSELERVNVVRTRRDKKSIFVSISDKKLVNDLLNLAEKLGDYK